MAAGGWNSLLQGLQFGARIGNQWVENERQAKRDAMAAEKFGWERDDRQRAVDDRARQDKAFNDYDELLKSQQAVATNTSGFSDGSARMLYGQGGQQAVDDAASYANVENRRMGLPVQYATSQREMPPAPAPEGGAPAQAPSPAQAPKPTVALRPMTEVDRLGGLLNIATAARDLSAMNTLGAARTKAQEDQQFGSWLKEYTGAPDQIGGTAQYLNTTSKRITMGAPGKNGMVPISFVQPDGQAEFLNLSRQDQAQLYAAGKLMDTNPTRALEVMGKVNKGLADAVAMENGLVDKVAQHQNTAAYQSGGLDVQRMNAETNRDYKNIMAGAAQQRANASGGKGAGAMWDQAVEIAGKGYYGGNAEKAYEGLKRGQVRGGVQEQADKLEMELRKSGLPEADVQKQLGGFLAGRGMPSVPALQALRSGRGADGKPLTEKDFADWNATYPAMPVEDVLGGSPTPTPEQMEIIRRDMESNNIPAATFSWGRGGVTTNGKVPGSAATGKSTGLPPRMAGGGDNGPYAPTLDGLNRAARAAALRAQVSTTGGAQQRTQGVNLYGR